MCLLSVRYGYQTSQGISPPLIVGEGGQAVENGVMVRVERTHAEQRGRESKEPVGLAACAEQHKPRHPHAKQGFGFLVCLSR